jgi:hypothetical protein
MPPISSHITTDETPFGWVASAQCMACAVKFTTQPVAAEQTALEDLVRMALTHVKARHSSLYPARRQGDRRKWRSS